MRPRRAETPHQDLASDIARTCATHKSATTKTASANARDCRATFFCPLRWVALATAPFRASRPEEEKLKNTKFMNTKKRSLIITVALFIVGSLTAAQWSHTTYGGSYSTWLTVPAAAVCAQFGGAYGGTSYITNYGPIGSYACNAGQSFQQQGTIPAGDYFIDQQVSGSGYSGCTITW
jgi:hypothetical protein